MEEATGVEFYREGLLAHEGFVYDTEPVCRAVVASRILAPEANLLQIFRASQKGFYVDAVDTTDGRLLAEIGAKALTAQGYEVTAEAFLDTWSAATTMRKAAADFAKSRALGMTSFPTLFAEKDSKLYRVGNGSASADALETFLAQIKAAA